MLLNWPETLNQTHFLNDYWQKKPLFIKHAVSGTPSPLTAEELAGLACETEIESRIICFDRLKNDWKLQQGPFDDRAFANLPDADWTLLVQDVDKFVPDAQEYLSAFRFIPDWRVDDLMVSYAVSGGSVGPHTDSYDVFLIQLNGKRRWQIDESRCADYRLLPDCPVRVLKEFTATREWICEPGDVLYLPPGLPHWGVALDDECMTGSVGFVSPRENELFESWSDEILASLGDNPAYADPDLTIQPHPAELTRQSLNKISLALDRLIESSRAERDVWIGKMLSASKQNLFIDPPAQTVKSSDLLPISRQYGLNRHPFLRMYFSRSDDQGYKLFANGEVFEISYDKRMGVFKLLCRIVSLQSRDSKQKLTAI